MDIAELLKVAGLYGPLGVGCVVFGWAFWKQLGKTEKVFEARLNDHRELIDATNESRKSIDANTRALELLAVKIEKVTS